MSGGIITQAPALLLDTCAVIWLANGEELAPPVISALMMAALTDGVFVSPVSAWEIGLLAHPPGGKAAMSFLPDAKSWFARLMAQPAIRAADLTADIAIDSTSLPGEFHRDPGDRLIVASARSLAMPVVTRDSRILDYARAGHVQALIC